MLNILTHWRERLYVRCHNRNMRRGFRWAVVEHMVDGVPLDAIRDKICHDGMSTGFDAGVYLALRMMRERLRGE